MSDQLSVRLNIASQAVTFATQAFDAIDRLKELQAQYLALGSTFQDSDFLNSDLKHLDAYTVGALLSNVTPAIDTTITDAGNGGFNKNILLKVRR